MDDTHTSSTHDGSPSRDREDRHPADALGALDPADSPAPAERFAHELAEELEEAGATPPRPVQLQADLDDGAPSSARPELE